MAKVVLEYDMYDDREEYELALAAYKYKHFYKEVWEKLFRPRHKHGYVDGRIDVLLENECCQHLMDRLEEIYKEVRQDTLGEG